MFFSPEVFTRTISQLPDDPLKTTQTNSGRVRGLLLWDQRTSKEALEFSVKDGMEKSICCYRNINN